jgi:transcriptional regulator with XRE-family HTH domain
VGRNFKELQAKMSPASRARSEHRAQVLLDEMALDELRVARQMTQEHLARILRTSQAAISKIERRADMYVSTLQNMVRAMGGALEIRAVFPEGNVVINQFEDLNEQQAKSKAEDSTSEGTPRAQS